ncbi:MAG: tRNA (adenosine(37)-N6)-threonylcarbamoyltransferase complex dimerization subunit type 1 TsaB [Paludibacteraceae bacterium]|nr:tRNA (adenosine(37)-N6)-threonylcarbamoyltransferase complex dimerization subunit type 1 TsaB [Paludibacteraceae bacterium]
MATIINIETSTPSCSLSVACNSEVILSLEDNSGMNHATLLGTYIKQAMDTIRERNLTLDAVCVSQGPGSYTGLRIGVSTAKGLCFGSGAKLIAVDTLAVIAEMARQENNINGTICPMIDARRMEVYTALYKADGSSTEVEAKIIDETSFAEELKSQDIYFCGNGAEKCQQTIKSDKAHFLANIHPSAKYMVRFAEERFKSGKFEDVAYFEPFYLKEFQTTVAKNKVL